MTQLRPMTCPMVLACDERYAMQLATTLRSIVKANPNGWPLEFHVLTHGMTMEIQKRVVDSLPKESASIHWIPVTLDLFERFHVTLHVSKMTYARLLIPQVISRAVPRVLYLDVDIIVLNSINALCETDMEGCVVGAVSDTINPVLKTECASVAGVPRVREYFNAGVLLIDLDRWRSEHISEKAFNYLMQHPRTPYWDQDALNVACDGRWKKLDPRWNFQSHFGTDIAKMAIEQRPWIVHFISKTKPWDPRSRSINARFYDSFRSKTCFARTPKDRFVDSLLRFRSGVQNVLRRCGFLSASVCVPISQMERGNQQSTATVGSDILVAKPSQSSQERVLFAKSRARDTSTDSVAQHTVQKPGTQ